MTLEGRARSAEALRRAAKQKSQHKLEAGLLAIREMARLRVPITVSSVARHANLSRPFVSKNPELRGEINRHSPVSLATRAETATSTIEDSVTTALRNVIRDMERRHAERVAELEDAVRTLRKNNAQLNDENARLRGQLRAL